ncbi:hypothetical protein HHL11_28760 [Ramlibacter sp. G-1-2-2]|uniref:Polysaccharide chain length determinant N-terminal domain-containing protein n=1 Tax=Ramlibacter agri TaxID=2728837 RepID=A0A848HBB3_9BURK|nr:hypothetical protein [Ramlibacter agri]NML47774.1 hypothetical protein [Ramlibacter agri]
MQKSIHPPESAGPTESSLFDLLLICVRHLRMLVLLPLAVGAAVYALAHFLPRTYSSVAIVQLPNNSKMTPRQVAALLTSAVVLDPVVGQLKLATSSNTNLDRARAVLAERLRAGVGRDQLVRLEVLGPTPESAQATAQAILDSWLKSTVPSDREQADLKRRLEVASEGFRNTQQALHSLTVESPNMAAKRESGTILVALGELAGRYLEQMLIIPIELQGVPRESVRQAPTLPTEPIRPRKGLLAITAAVVTAAAIVLVLALLHLLDLAHRIPARADKLRRLRAALRASGTKKDAAHA